MANITACRLALACGLAIAALDWAPAWFQQWAIFKNDDAYLWIRGIEFGVSLFFVALGRCPPLLVFSAVVGPGLVYRIGTHIALSGHISPQGGEYNLAPIAVAFELIAAGPALLVCLVSAGIGGWRRRH